MTGGKAPTILDTIHIDPHSVRFWKYYSGKELWKYFHIDTDDALLYVDGVLSKGVKNKT